MQIDLSGKVAVVTGASGQLGRVMARTLAQCGADVAMHYLRNQEQAERVREEVEALGVRAMTVQADVTVAAEVMAMRDAVVAQFGAPHIIVNNAVIQYHGPRFWNRTRPITNRSFVRACCTTS